MITVPQATETIVKRSRFLSEAMSKGLLNYSSLARYIKPEVEEMLIKNVSDAAIIMALKRMELQQKPHTKYTILLKSPPEITIRSHLVCGYFTTTSSLLKKIAKLKSHNEFYLQTQDKNETVLITAATNLPTEPMMQQLHNVSALTICLPKAQKQTPDIFYFFLKSLAWEEITVHEVFSTTKEVTIVVEDKEVNRAFSVLTSLFSVR